MESAKTPNGVLRRVDDVIKSAEDKRSYRGLELKNHMKVLLVSDPTTDRSAASMDVNIGKVPIYQCWTSVIYGNEYIL